MIAILIIAILCFRASGRILKAPESKIVWVGSRTTLDCETDTLPMFWNFAEAGTTTDAFVIYTGEKFKPTVKSRYSIENLGTSLVMPRVSKEHAGRYECEDNNSFGEMRRAELVVVEFSDKEFINCSADRVQAYYNRNNINLVKNCTSGYDEQNICTCRICLESNEACTTGTYRYNPPVVTSSDPPEEPSSTIGESARSGQVKLKRPNAPVIATILVFIVIL